MGWGRSLGGSEGGAIPVLLPVGKGGGGVVYVELWGAYTRMWAEMQV